MECKTCVYFHNPFVDKTFVKEVVKGFCMRYPPSVVSLPDPRGMSSVETKSPVVRETDFCGEWVEGEED